MNSIVKITGDDGLARTVFTLGFESGINNNAVTATFQGQVGLVATFTATALQPGDPAETTFSGVVLDNSQNPIPQAVITIDGTAVSGTTDDNGQFLLTDVPVGPITLHIEPPDPATLPPGSPRFPPLEFETVTVAGIENILGQPILLPFVDTASSQLIGGAQDVTLTMAAIPGLELTVFANSVTFPDGSTTGQLTISQVHLDQIPMPPIKGQSPLVAWTIQPAGVKFDPPARIKMPNFAGAPPGSLQPVGQFDHDLFTFVTVGQGTVTEDGLFVISDPGFGITRSGWGCIYRIFAFFANMINCDDQNTCTDDSPLPGGGCSNEMPPERAGEPCQNTKDIVVNDSLIIDQSCNVGKCDPNKECRPDPDEKTFNPDVILDGIAKAKATFTTTTQTCMPSDLKNQMKEGFDAATKDDPLIIECKQEDFTLDGAEVPCGYSSGNRVGIVAAPESLLNNSDPDFKVSTEFYCGDVGMILRHEWQHTFAEEGSVVHTMSENGGRDYTRDRIEACDFTCFPSEYASAIQNRQRLNTITAVNEGSLTCGKQ